MKPPTPRPFTALLTALAVIASAWPLNTLLQQPSWMLPTFATVAVVAVTGVVCRWLRLPTMAIPVAQLAAVVGVFVVVFPGVYNPVVRLLPGSAEFAAWSSLFSDAFTTLRARAAPVETTPSVQAVLLVGVAGVAVWCDVLAVTWRMPALSALPLMVPFLTAVANSDHPLPWYYPTLVVVAWMLTLLTEEGTAHRSAQSLRAWKHAPGVAVAMLVALSCVAASSLVVPLIPHPEARYITQGLGRGPNGGKGTKFDPSTDLAKDLRSQSPAAVLSYRTDDPHPGPLRIAVSSRLDQGVWKRDDLAAVPSSRPVLPYPVGIEGNTPQKKYTLSVQETSLESPLLATPGNVVGGTVTGAQWGVDARTGVAVTDVTPVRYELSYLSVDVDAVRARQKRLGTAGTVDEGAAAGQRGELLQIGQELERRLDVLAPSVVKNAPSEYAAALAIQNWLRSTGGFTYSLELGDAPAGPQASSDSGMLRFFSSKRGYCVHFATAMVMLAMWSGIPARFVTGFLPGTSDGTTWRVKASDAHAWPELLLPGMGWTRFEPTPSGAAPVYAAAPAPTTSSAPPSASASPSQRPEREPRPSSPARDSQADLDAQGWSVSIPTWAWITLVILAILAALLGTAIAVMRWLASRARRPDAAPSHGSHPVWDNLVDDLEDLGVPPTQQPTAAGRLRHYTRAAHLDERGATALQVVVDEVEDALYAAVPRGRDVTEYTTTVVECAAAATTRQARLVARWFPLSGRREAARMLTQVAGRPTRQNRPHAERQAR